MSRSTGIALRLARAARAFGTLEAVMATRSLPGMDRLIESYDRARWGGPREETQRVGRAGVCVPALPIVPRCGASPGVNGGDNFLSPCRPLPPDGLRPRAGSAAGTSGLPPGGRASAGRNRRCSGARGVARLDAADSGPVQAVPGGPCSRPIRADPTLLTVCNTVTRVRQRVRAPRRSPC